MNTRPVPRFLAGLAAAVFFVLLIAGLALASGEQIIWQVISGGGQESSGSWSLQGTTGQAVAGQASGGEFELSSGFTTGPSSGPQGPTAVIVIEFHATPRAGAVMVEWQTASEIDVVGFNIYRSRDLNGEKQILNAQIIPAAVPGQISGANYDYIDFTAEHGKEYFYWLEILSTSGGAWLGPEMFSSRFYLHLPLILR